MTTNDLIPFRDNKDSYYWLMKELVEIRHEVTTLRDQTDCMQKSVADLRKNLSGTLKSAERSKDKSFWIHW